MINQATPHSKVHIALTLRHLPYLIVMALILTWSNSSLSQPLACTGLAPKHQSFSFLHAIFFQNAPPHEKLNQLEQACDQFVLPKNKRLLEARGELKKMQSNKDLNQAVRDSFQDLVEDVTKTETAAHPLMQKYYQELIALNRYQDPYERMKQIYNLVIRSQGRYMPTKKRDSQSEVTLSRVADTLIRAATTGEGGVCRDFAVLLAWSLNQANRDTNGNTLFLARLEDLFTHVVVTVATDQGEFSLDSTQFATFNPLPVPDLDSPASHLQKRANACHKVAECYASQIGPQPMPVIEVSSKSEEK